MEAGRATFTMRALRPRDIVEQALDPIAGAFAEKKITLDIQTPEDLPDVQADPAGIGSALTNLLTNALKYTPCGGRVKVAVGIEGDSVAFSVADTGPGIPEQYASRIFDKFFRVPTNGGPPGAGLGLSITKTIIAAHGGRIDFTCPDTGGSVFRICLPIPVPTQRELVIT
jgi:histidine kinase